MIGRYTLPKMAFLWNRKETKFEYWWMVELAVLQAYVSMGQLSQRAYRAIERHAVIDVRRIERIEASTNHDMIAFVKCIQYYLIKAGFAKYSDRVHEEVTSYDVEDPALILMLRQAVQYCLDELRLLEEALRTRAREHKWTLMIGRSHGQYGQPDTFGHLLLVYAEQVERSIIRLECLLEEELSQGKVSGAMGNFAEVSPRLEKLTLKSLGLKPAKAETQILQRDRHAAVVSALAIAAATIEHMAKTFWVMMRSDVGELREPRRKNQKGSSAMSHKRNPILTERLLGHARLVRANAIVAFENIATFEAREISQSSAERVILPDATTIVHYMARKATSLVSRLEVFPDRMMESLQRTQGVWASQRVRNQLMTAGLSSKVAYDYTQKLGFQAADRRVPMLGLLMQTSLSRRDKRTAADVLGAVALRRCFNPRSHVSRGVRHMFRD